MKPYAMLSTHELVLAALAEDIGDGDRTTLWTVPAGAVAQARIVAKAPGVIAGIEVAREVVCAVDRSVEMSPQVKDGDSVEAGDLVMTLHGSARSLLSAERVTLNFLQRLSGVATLTREYVRRVEGTGARILDTRKTTPGMRLLEKAAVRAGGGTNHRIGLFDMVLIKENHIAAAGGITAAVEAVRAQNREGLRVEVETRNLEEVDEALRAGVDVILFDNMPLEMLREAVARVRASGTGTRTEASGGVTLETVGAIARTGVDLISVGALTHSAPALDLSMLIEG
ncbi:MAG TPA: carboxylating nicotinate-nucleotide diphosphorylase [Longimicrobiaceae bacterium]